MTIKPLDVRFFNAELEKMKNKIAGISLARNR